ncbi:type II toxin-antitoxin system RelB/DinJ family antitoxin [Olsenella uli]|uniref:type II toxin-antitoxin system RelB/DinJ family antitoxin n=1 Tax=Olsenella uli TaxID=133926 RepID=UPI00195EDCA9|nr:type II toxin-antitoxin system RelB/DinJ family antitoxin [Olsenella uli]MBM6815945.1 type II toxin-antitoxin system RelB/DinJ family antitoxin [Olsenella uli]
MTSYAIRVDEDLKAGASEVAKSFGLDLASVTRAFWTYMVRTGSIPITFDGEQPNEESLEAIRETEEIFAAHARGEIKGYDSAAEMFAALEA